MTENLILQWKSREKYLSKELNKKVRKLTKKTNKTLDSDAQTVHDDVFKSIDCLDCANCCTSIPPMVTKSDSKRISKYLGMKEMDFISQYLKMDSDGDMVMKSSPCVFLENDNKCEIYEVRPKACRQYPHTDGYEFRKNAHLHAENANYCPAAYHIIERLSNLGK